MILPRKHYLAGVIAVFIGLALFWSFDLPSVSAGDGDILAIRVYKNTTHLSAKDWYEENISSKGSPASVKIDGYEGVLDGSSAYVSAANISGSNMYANIYVLSINQGADKETKEIFNRILKNWRFNVNLSAGDQASGKCYLIGKKSCTSNSNCGNGQNCSSSGFCVLNSDVPCQLDSDCDPVFGDKGIFCDSQKTKIIHDLRRLEAVARLKKYLEIYKDEAGKYPDVGDTGTYVPGLTVSTWPNSWAALGNKLNSPMIVDPINYMGDCTNSKADPVSCWDSTSKAFSMDSSKAYVIMYRDPTFTGSYFGSSEYFKANRFETSYSKN